MNDSDDVMTSIYNTLLHLRYPHITNTESKDLEATILSGENRVCLLSWLLTEKSPSLGINLEKLKNAALEDQLFEYYSQIGICNNKNGKCSFKEQLPVLRLLLDFMKKVYMEPLPSTSETEETLTDIIKLCIDDAEQASSSLAVIKPKISYAEANKYIEESEKEMLNNDCEEIRINLSEDLHVETDNRLVNEEQDALFDKEKERFVEAFHTVSSWPVKVRSLDKNISDSICSNIKTICSDFSSLKKVLQAKEEISHVKLAKELPKTATPLNAIIEDIVIYNEELENLISNGDE
ncbi:uncharacterized protein LOC105202059 isoform X2 [Solenopsis invicta]|uniref:uncharacterized protein LOC105202059 isoform X2 n=1 Tax=Solenopsis invicta TaxID=13686 RepID=UPI00193D4319|nr:uncharacterized protein LOC105202059 isoform X2 [Solenopsis invicta]